MHRVDEAVADYYTIGVSPTKAPAKKVKIALGPDGLPI